MGNQWDLSNLNLDDDEEDDNGSGQNSQKVNVPKGLRTQLKAITDQNKEMADRIAKYEAAARQGAIDGIIKEQKLNPKVASLIPKDVESTPEAVGKWLEEYKELFSPPQQQQDDGISDEEDDGSYTVDALQRIARAQNAAMPPTKAADLMAKINDPNMTPEKLMALIASHGGGYGG